MRTPRHTKTDFWRPPTPHGGVRELARCTAVAVWSSPLIIWPLPNGDSPNRTLVAPNTSEQSDLRPTEGVVRTPDAVTDLAQGTTVPEPWQVAVPWWARQPTLPLSAFVLPYPTNPILVRRSQLLDSIARCISPAIERKCEQTVALTAACQLPLSFVLLD